MNRAELFERWRSIAQRLLVRRTATKHPPAASKPPQVQHGRNRLKTLNRQYAPPQLKVRNLVGKTAEFTGLVQKQDNQMHMVVPHDKRLPLFRVNARDADEFANQQVTCTFEIWQQGKMRPLAKVRSALNDKFSAMDAEMRILMSEYNIRDAPFTAAQLQGLPDEEWRPAEPLDAHRQDFRHLDVFSIDPEGCEDIDDALHFRRLPNGNVEVGVHIADVSHFVRADSPLDLEASKRCTSVYLSGRRIDMLPEILSTNICSLHADEERYTFSVLWEMNSAAEIVGAPRFTKSLIRSRRAYTYQQAQDLIDGKMEDSPVFVQSLRGLMDLSRVMRERRRQRGSLMLLSMEVRYVFDEQQMPVDVQEKCQLETMSLIEEFMLQANVSVAETILAAFPSAALLRRHPQPTAEAFEPLEKAFKEWNFPLDVSTNESLARSLDNAVVDGNPDVNRMLRVLATRCMSLAVYFPAGCSPEHAHYGLAAPTYTHFTSPIRRYADIVVHRQLATAMGLVQARRMASMFRRYHLEQLAAVMTQRHRMAKRASFASNLLQAKFLLEREPADADGFVTQIRDDDVTVVVMKYGVESHVKVPPNCPVVLRLLQKVRVRLSVIERNQRRFLSLKIVEPSLEVDIAEVRPAEVTSGEEVDL